MNWLFVVLLLQLYRAVDSAYHGKLISRGFGSTATHGLSGDIYAVDEDSFQIINFNFDGTAGSVFYVGVDKSYSQAKGAGKDETAVEIQSTSSGSGLPVYTDANTVFYLPSTSKLQDVTYIAVYNKNDGFYGGVDLPSNFKPPAPLNIGKLSTHAHSVTSGEITILNDRTIQIKRLRYDGQGPDAFFYVGVTDKVQLQNAPYGKIPDENGVDERKARAYSDEDIMLILPEAISATNLKWLSIYCITYKHNFGEVFFPADVNVPPYMEISLNRTGLNCEALSDKLQVSWVVTNDTISIELAGNIDRSTDYMAFGLSGEESTFAMIGADVVVVDWMEGKEARATDYMLTAYSQCGDVDGVCPDTDKSNQGTNDIRQVTGELTNGITRIKYQRNLVTDDTRNDKEYKLDTPQQIVWAIGPLNSKYEAAKHYTQDRISKSKAIIFGRPPVSNCPAFQFKAEPEKPDFKEQIIYGDEVNNAFTVTIGQSNSEQGYKAITGSPSWGIAWYINGMLVPRLYLKRGVEYEFRVHGGTDPQEGSMYHPFYLTTDKNGGRLLKSNSTETIFPGILNGKASDYGLGGYCEWKLTTDAIKAVTEGKIYQCFEEFRQDLYLDCTDNPRGIFKFTPDQNTPDEIYYQCFTHENLGWKIMIVDEYPAERKRGEDGCTLTSSSSFSYISYLVVIISMTAYYIY